MKSQSNVIFLLMKFLGHLSGLSSCPPHYRDFDFSGNLKNLSIQILILLHQMFFLELKSFYLDNSLKYLKLFWIFFIYHFGVIFFWRIYPTYKVLSLIMANGKSFRMSQALHIGHARVLLLLQMYPFLSPNEEIQGPFPLLTLIQELW